MCCPFSAASRVSVRFEMLTRSSPCTVGSVMFSISPTSLSCRWLLASVSTLTPSIHNQMDVHASVIAVQKERRQWKKATDTVIVCLGVFCCHQAFPYMYFWYKLPCLSCLNICLVCNFKSHFTQITKQHTCFT